MQFVVAITENDNAGTHSGFDRWGFMHINNERDSEQLYGENLFVLKLVESTSKKRWWIVVYLKYMLVKFNCS